MVPITLYVVFTREFRKIARYTRAYGLSPVLRAWNRECGGNVAGIGHLERMATETDLE